MAEECARVVEEEEAFSDLYLTGVEFAGEGNARELGRGSYGVVYEVMWRGTPCAAKKIHPLLLQAVPGGVNSVIRGFIKECSTWSKLRHPHVAQFLGLYRTPGDQLPLLITEKMETSLSQLLQTHTREAFPLPHKVSVLRQVALGLAYLHGTTPPTAHRDLSANNILVNTIALTAKITDFGVAKLMDPARTRSHTMMPGTHAYMAPEAELGPSCDYTEKVDIFSLGVLIIHTLTHQLPMPGPTRAKVNGKMIAVGEYERREHYLKVCSDAEVESFQEHIKRSLEFDPDDRITPAELVQHFHTIQELVGEPTIGNSLQDTPQLKEGEEARQDKLLAAELKARRIEEELQEARRLREEEVVTLKIKIEELQHRLEEVPGVIREETSAAGKQQGAGGQVALDNSDKGYNIGGDQYWSSKEIMKFGQPKLDPPLWCRNEHITVSNAVHINGDFYLSFKQSRSGQPNYLKKVTRVHQGKPQMEQFMPVLPWPVINFGLTSFKGSLLFVGGKFTSANKPAGAGIYSNKVFTYSPETKEFEVTLPPMRVACALPSVITHEGLIIVIRGEGHSGIEVLDTTSPNPEWKETAPLPYYSATASATAVAGYLVVWIGAVYCMHLSCITAPTKSTQYLHSSWFALPSPPESVSVRLANYKGSLAAFAIDKDYSTVYLYIFDHKSKQWINLQEIGGVSVPDDRSSAVQICASVTAQSVLVVWECEQQQQGFYYQGLAIQTGAIQE